MDPSAFERFKADIFARKDVLIKDLADAVAVQSVSSDPARRGECVRMMEIAAAKIRALGGTAEIHDIGEEKPGLPLPPIVTGEIKSSVADAPTILVYGHLDVQPADKEKDGWNTEPFVLTPGEKNGTPVLFGRGSTDDKGPVYGWMWAIEAHQRLGVPIPANVKFLLEGMEESGSVGLKEFIEANKDKDFLKSDASVISDNYLLGPTKPCVTYGLRGLAYFSVEVTCSNADRHSGVYGGPLHEANTDLFKIFASLHDSTGQIAIPGIYDSVLPMTEEEKKSYETIDFDPAEFAKEAGAKALRFDSKMDVLASRWRYPSLSIHGIEGAWAGAGAKTVIPKSVIGKFSIRLVPDQDPAKIEELVKKHIEAQFAALKSPNTLKVTMLSGAKAWLADVNDGNFSACRTAVKQVFGVEPDLTREGGSIPLTLWISEATGKSVALLPIGACDDGAHSANEKFNVSSMLNGTVLLGAYLHCFAANYGKK